MSVLTALSAQLTNWAENEVKTKWYVWYYREPATRGWQEICGHYSDLIKITDQGILETEKTAKLPVEDRFFTTVEYKTFTLQIRGMIPVNEDLYFVCIWQYWYYNQVFQSQATFGRCCFMQYKMHPFGLIQPGKFSPLKTRPPIDTDLIINIGGSSDDKKVEIFNGSRNLYLKVIQKKDHYSVQVAERPSEVDKESLFILSEDEGFIKLCIDSTLALKVDEEKEEVVVQPYDSKRPEFHFNLSCSKCNADPL